MNWFKGKNTTGKLWKTPMIFSWENRIAPGPWTPWTSRFIAEHSEPHAERFANWIADA